MAFVNITNNTFNPYSKETLNEGQFSWMTYDTDKQIGSEKQNTINVYMYDNEGNQWFEKKYDGYGEFGGMDYYALLAKMNGYSAEDITKKGMEMRDLGIDLAFNKLKTKAKGGKVLFPALVEDPKFNWKRHDFTQEAESDENQSWYQEPDYDEEEDDDYENGWYESLKTNEGAMSEIHIMAKEAKDAEDFKKEFYKEYGTKIKKSGETDKWIKELYVDATNESAITEAKLTRGLKPLLTIGSTITKKAGEDALLDLSDKFDRIDDEYAGTIASWLDMAIELMQDRYAGAATKKLKQFNKACKDVLNGKEVGSAFESVTENRMLRKGQFKFGAKLQYGIEDVNESYGFYGTLTNQFGLDEVNELFLDGFAVLDTNYDFTDQAALYYLNSKAGRWVADQVIEKLVGAKNMSPYYGHLEEIFAEYTKKGQWKKWAKEYDQFAEEDNMEEGLMIRESRSSKDEYYRELLEAEQTTNDQSPLGDGGMETGIKNKAEESGVPVGLLRIIMRRGLAAWKTGHRPGATQAQWGYARVNSFLTKQPGTWGKADSDIAKKVRDGGHDKEL